MLVLWFQSPLAHLPATSVSLDDLHNSINQEVLSRLGFDLDDYDAVNDLYRRWRTHGRDSDRETLLLWLFAYCRRYFVTRALQEKDFRLSDVESMITVVFHRCYQHLNDINDHDAFPNYVMVVCKNSFINLIRRKMRHPQETFDSFAHDSIDPDDPEEEVDRILKLKSVERAVERLPKHLAIVFRMRFMQDLSYDEIQERTGHPKGRARKYVYRALIRLREDADVACLIRDSES